MSKNVQTVKVSEFHEATILIDGLTPLEWGLWAAAHALTWLVPSHRLENWLVRRWIHFVTLRHDEKCVLIDGHRHPASGSIPSDFDGKKYKTITLTLPD